MRLPSVSLQFPRLALDWFADLGARRVLFYTLYTVVLFVVFLFVNFPYQDLIQQTLRGVDLGGMEVQVAGTRFAWWKGWEIGNLRILPVGAPEGTPPLLEGSTLYVRPSLAGLIRGQLRGLHLEGAMYGGGVDADVALADGITRATVDLDGVNLGRVHLLADALEGGQITGRLSGTVTFEVRPPNLAAGQAAGEIEIRGGSVAGVKVKDMPVPDLHFPQLTTKFSLKSGRLDIQDLHADGDEVKLSGNGQIVLRDPFPDSVLNLKATFQPGSEGDIGKTLIALLPRPPGGRPDAPVSITGTIAQPRMR